MNERRIRKRNSMKTSGVAAVAFATVLCVSAEEFKADLVIYGSSPAAV